MNSNDLQLFNYKELTDSITGVEYVTITKQEVQLLVSDGIHSGWESGFHNGFKAGGFTVLCCCGLMWLYMKINKYLNKKS